MRRLLFLVHADELEASVWTTPHPRLPELAQLCVCGRDRGDHLNEPPNAAEDDGGAVCLGFTPQMKCPGAADTARGVAEPQATEVQRA